jgi:hypothetical protein
MRPRRQPQLVGPIAATVVALLCSPAIGAPAGRVATSSSKAPEPPTSQPVRLGSGYSRVADRERKLYYVSALDAEHFAMTAGLLGKFSDAFNETLRAQRPQWRIIILLPTVEDYRRLAPTKDVVGFYRPSDRTLISIDRGRVLIHEFTHALHHADAAAADQQHPVWIWEGLGSLFDASMIGPSGLQPQVDLRLLPLQSAIRSEKTIPLARLLTLKPDAFTRQSELCYSEARYLLLYLHRQGRLSEWYETYKAGFRNDSTGKDALEKVLGKRLERIEEEWEDWVKKLQLPWGERQAGRARLGLRLQDTRNGVKVAGFVEGGAAERAGRIQKGDILLRVNGYKLANTAHAIGAIHSAGAMQTVTIELKRHGRRMTVHQPLGAPPGR